MYKGVVGTGGSGIQHLQIQWIDRGKYHSSYMEMPHMGMLRAFVRKRPIKRIVETSTMVMIEFDDIYHTKYIAAV